MVKDIGGVELYSCRVHTDNLQLNSRVFRVQKYAIFKGDLVYNSVTYLICSAPSLTEQVNHSIPGVYM